jgi:hypothetical protein
MSLPCRSGLLEVGIELNVNLVSQNLQGKLLRYPVWHNPNDVLPFVDESKNPPPACPSIVNAKDLGLPSLKSNL